MDAVICVVETSSDIVAVVGAFTLLLSGLVTGFLTHLATKDKRVAAIAEQTTEALTGVKTELRGLSVATWNQSHTLEALTNAIRSQRCAECGQSVTRPAEISEPLKGK